MFDYEEIYNIPPYSLTQAEKEEKYAAWMHELSEHHREKCAPYARICEATGMDAPSLPVRLFKEYTLKSTGEDDVAKTMTSSVLQASRFPKYIWIKRHLHARQKF